MNKIIAVSVIALALTTGFTCSKNTPPEPVTETTVPAVQEEMAAPTDAAPAEATTETTVPASH